MYEGHKCSLVVLTIAILQAWIYVLMKAKFPLTLIITYFAIVTSLVLTVSFTFLQVSIQSVFAISEYDSNSNFKTISANPSKNDFENVFTTESTVVFVDKQLASCNAKWKPVKRDFRGTTMVKVPAGKFRMGSNDYHDEQPVSTQAFTSPFWIDETEVTREAYERCILIGVCTSTPNNTYSTEPNQPINWVTWYQAATYCKWRRAHLPTEAEWEYAARGPDNLVYPWGNEFDSERVNYGNPFGQIMTVGSYEDGASWVGAKNMAGNASEWICSTYTAYPYNENDGRNLTGSESNVGKEVVVRGGSFGDDFDFVSTMDRNRFSASAEFNFNGFRCALSKETVVPSPSQGI